MTDTNHSSSLYFTGQNQPRNQDYFDAVFENRWSKWISIIFSVLGSILSICMICCIIWFEFYGQDVRRTLINRLFISADYIGVIYVGFYQQLDLLRYMYGPLPQYVCHFTDYSKFAITNQVFLTFAFIMLSRYLFIFCLKNPAGFYDEFWYKFILGWIIIFSWISQIAVYMGPGKQFPNFYICAGINPIADEKFGEKNHTFNGIIRICSVVIQLLISIRIKYYKWKHSGEISQTVMFGTENVFPIVFMFFVIVLQFPRQKIELYKLNEFPLYLTEYFFTLIRPIVTVLLMASIKFIKDSTFRFVLQKEIKNLSVKFCNSN